MPTPDIQPNKVAEYAVHQSTYGDVVPQLPTRATMLAPSSSGNTVLISNLIIDVQRGCVNRMYTSHQLLTSTIISSPLKITPRKELNTNEKEPTFRQRLANIFTKHLLIYSIQL